MARFRLEWMSLVCLLTGTIFNLSLFYKTTDALDCHCTSGCDSNFQCNGSSICTRGWSGPTCQRYNLALGKDTIQSSTVNDCKWADTATKRAACGWKDSSLAVDGVRSTEYWSGTCTHTDSGQNQAWWKVDLGQIHQIYYINIYSPVTNPQRMENFTVKVDGKPCYTRSPGYSLDPPLSIHCTAPVNGRSVLIRAYQNDLVLNLCEVEVYECADGVFGEQCNSLCNCKNRGEVCDKVTGHCHSGCADGYTGEGCQALCTDFWFGEQCSTECSCKDLGEVCNKTTGECVRSGCQDGRTGVDCQTHCRQGHYGPECRRCGQCLDNSPCDKQTGLCAEGCQPGWKGDNCLEGNIAKSGTIEVFDLVESTAPLSLYGNPEVTRDGNTSLESCVTITGRQPSWKITFPKKHSVFGVGIYMAEGDATRINVVVDDSFCYHGSVKQSYNPCSEPLEGKSVKIYLSLGDRFKNLTICEVYVYADENLESVFSVPTFIIILAVVGVVVSMVIGIVFVLLRCRRHRQVRDRPKDDGVVHAEAEGADDNQDPQQDDPDHLYNEVADIIYLEPVASDTRFKAENSTYSKFQGSIPHHYEVMPKRDNIELEAHADLPVDGTQPPTCSETVDSEYVNDRFQAERSTYSQPQESDNHHYEVMLKDVNN